ncbi:MAG: prolipoprotein diacylglyceryl transferase [Candidatus Kapabacteria bacterium]|nr:prolipoprotein diacylglyceryl transferase [Candidatus Kapabacteria bacterium]
MYPILFKIGPFPVYGFGLMMALAFLAANYLFTRQTRRQKLHDDIPSTVTLIALGAGVSGSKLFHILENPSLFFRDPVGTVFSGDGLTFYGGLLMAIAGIAFYLHRKKIPFLLIADCVAPALILAYGIGRIGCQLAGDGDYGIPSDLPWAMGYPNGTVPTLSSLNPQLAALYQQMHPGVTVPYDIAVHPTPVYETLACFMMFGILAFLQRNVTRHKTGWLFGVYLCFAAVERFSVEFLRLNELYAGLSQAQWISIGLLITGLYLINTKKSPSTQVS